METKFIDTSRELKVVTVVRGNRGPAGPMHKLICSNDGLEDFFEGAQPPIDLPTGFIGAIALGEKRTGGFHVEVTSAYQITYGIATGLVHINYREVKAGGVQTDELTYPFLIFSLPDLQYATSVIFNKISSDTETVPSRASATGHSGNYIVIENLNNRFDCKIIPENAPFLAIFRQVFGPASFEACEEYLAKHTPWATTNIKCGMFIGSYQLGGTMPGQPEITLWLAFDAPTKTVMGRAHLLWPVSPPVDKYVEVSGNYFYMTVMPNITHIRVNLTGEGNLEIVMVLENDWETGRCNISFLDGSGAAHKADQLPVKSIPWNPAPASFLSVPDGDQQTSSFLQP